MIARIEKGRVSPRFETVLKLIRACEMNLEIEPMIGQGVDRTTIQQMLRLTATKRAEMAGAEARNLERFESLVRK